MGRKNRPWTGRDKNFDYRSRIADDRSYRGESVATVQSVYDLPVEMLNKSPYTVTFTRIPGVMLSRIARGRAPGPEKIVQGPAGSTTERVLLPHAGYDASPKHDGIHGVFFFGDDIGKGLTSPSTPDGVKLKKSVAGA